MYPDYNEGGFARMLQEEPQRVKLKAEIAPDPTAKRIGDTDPPDINSELPSNSRERRRGAG